MRHLTTLRFIDAIARARSIRAAAEAMNITASALNRRLLAVEEELDAPLFERLATGVRLSAAGELFLAHARRQLADMERVRSHIEDMKGVRRGHVSFGFDNSLVPGGFGKAVQMYQGQHPDVTFGIETADENAIISGLTDYHFDLAGLVQPKPKPTLTTLATAPLSISAVMGPTHPLAKRGTVRLNDILAFPLVLPLPGSLRSLLNIATNKQDLILKPIAECDLTFASGILRAGRAVGFQVNASTRHEVSIEGMVAVPVSQKDIALPYLHLVQLRGRPLSVAAGRFADMLTQRFARYSGEQ